MNLLTYMHTRDQRATEVWQEIANAVGSSPAYISQIAYGHRDPSPVLAQEIERATGGAVTRGDLRPDVYGLPSAAA